MPFNLNIDIFINTKDMTSQLQTADNFLSFSNKYKLGCLLTEQQNPKTVGLSSLAQHNLPQAINVIKQLDVQTIHILQTKLPQLSNMYQDVNQTLESGGNIFICGCGATGRLSIVLETIWRQECNLCLGDWKDRVISFMAGGDVALIKSIEDFEDHPQFAEQQLVELGFKQNDLLIGSTEGGETPWVIGAIWKSTHISKRKPYILYGNTDEILKQNVERSREFIESDKINKINCNVGYMALAGSTRMQSTTILMYAIGLTLVGCDRMRQAKKINKSWKEFAAESVGTFLKYIEHTNFNQLGQLIEFETNLYKNKECLTYRTDSYYAVSILTDTTERSPTFSLAPFENKYQKSTGRESWCNLNILHKGNQQQLNWDDQVEKDWREVLGGRQIRGLNSPFWKNYQQKVTNKVMMGFGLHQCRQNAITISYPLRFQAKSKLKQQIVEFSPYATEDRLSQHCLIKILLNNLSTLIMGKMERYESNIMTYVKPTNYKLIDRSARYIQILRKETSYEEAVRAIYELKGKIGIDEPIVLKCIQYLNQKK